VTQEVALNLTNSSIPCSVDMFNISILPKFEHKKYMVRTDESNDDSVWFYAQNFKILPAPKNHTMAMNQTMIDPNNNQTMPNNQTMVSNRTQLN
jgi:hypothetical protein